GPAGARLALFASSGCRSIERFYQDQRLRPIAGTRLSAARYREKLCGSWRALLRASGRPARTNALTGTAKPQPARNLGPPPAPNPALAALAAAPAGASRRKAFGLIPARLRLHWLRNGRSIGSRVGSRIVGLGLRIVQNGLAPPHGLRVFPRDPNFMSALGELLERGRRDANLDSHVASAGTALGESRRLHSGLHVHSIIHNIGNKLRMGEGLVEAAHNAKADVQIALFHKSGNNGVQRALAAGQHVRMFGVESEIFAAIVQ